MADSKSAMRSKLYQLFAMAVSYPDDDWVAAIKAGELADTLQHLLGQLDRSLLQDFDQKALSDSGEQDESLAVEYTRLFDIGPGGSPISLYGGHHYGGRTGAMEEVMRFYQHFGLQLEQTQVELPDHLVSELEFLHFMTFQEARLEEQGADTSHYRRGQKDFIERQLGRWVPGLYVKIQEENALPLYTELFRLLSCFLQFEQQQLNPSLICVSYPS